jgi:diadenosine tetraphosphate (Ap4A) HIT family hydrolase
MTDPAAPPTAIHKAVELCRSDNEKRLICRMKSGWAVLFPEQVQPGYSLLLPDPVVGQLNDLQGQARLDYLHDMTLLGDAILAATKCRRINYEILGNLEPALHAHVIPRYLDEPADLRNRPIWFYDFAAAPKFDPQLHGPLQRQIAQFIQDRIIQDRIIQGQTS